MAINLKDLVKEEPPNCYEESFYHVSGLHICKEFSNYVYYVIPNNEFKNIHDLDIHKSSRTKHLSFKSALNEANQIVEFANTRGAQDARFIQKRRGSNYKVNSSDNSEDDKVQSQIIKPTKLFSRIYINNKNIKEFNNKKRNTHTDKLSSSQKGNDNGYKNIYKNAKNILKLKIKKSKNIFKKYLFYKIYETAKNSKSLNLLKQKLSTRQKYLIKKYSTFLFIFFDTSFYKEKITKIFPREKTKLKSALISYKCDGFENYFLARDINSNEIFEKKDKELDTFVFLSNKSASTNEITAEIKSHNIFKLNQKLFCAVRKGVPILPGELAAGRHLKNKEIGTFTNEKDAIDWVYKNLDNDEVGITIDKAPLLVETLINNNDVGIFNYLYFYNGTYILVPSFYGINERVLSNELSNLKNFKEKYSQIAVADDKDFIKEIFKTRETLPENCNYKNKEYTIFKDDNSMLLRDNLKNLNYDLLNIDSIGKLKDNERKKIKNLIFNFDKKESSKIKSDTTMSQKFNIINNIGEMYIIENEGYFIAIKPKYLENFPDNNYINDIETRYDVSLSVIEDYCKTLL